MSWSDLLLTALYGAKDGPQGLDSLSAAIFQGKHRDSCGCSTWRTDDSRETLEPLPVPKGAPGELERDFRHDHEVTGQGGMASHCKRAGLDGILGIHS